MTGDFILLYWEIHRLCHQCGAVWIVFIIKKQHPLQKGINVTMKGICTGFNADELLGI